MKNPIRRPVLRNLRRFTAEYGSTNPKSTAEVARFAKWIRRVTSASQLEVLRVIADGDLVDGEEEGETTWDWCTTHHDSDHGVDHANPVSPSIDGLIEHLAAKHASTLKHLHMRSMLISLKGLACLLQSCRLLQTLHFSGGRTAFVRDLAVYCRRDSPTFPPI